MRRPELADGVARAAAAAARPVVDVDLGQPRSLWATTSCLVVDIDAARELIAAVGEVRLPRRDGVAVVCAHAGLEELRLGMHLGAAQVFALPEDLRALARFLSGHEADGAETSQVVAVLGGHGGAGASLFAAALALAAPARGLSVLAVDADPWGGGLDLLLGCEDMPGLRWPDLSLRGGQVPSGALVAALPGRADELAVLSAGRGGADIGTEAVLAVLDAGRRSVGITVVDLPRRDDGVTAACLEVADLCVLVTAATLRGCAASRVVADALGTRARALRLVVRGPAPGGLRAVEVERAVGVPVLAAMRAQPGLDASVDGGGLRLRRGSPLADAAGRVLDGVRGRAQRSGAGAVA